MDDQPQVESFFLVTRVMLHQPTAASDELPSIRGYYIHIGLKARNRKDAVEMLETVLGDGRIDWGETVWYDVDTIDPTIALRQVGVSEPGIWYRSGRICFP